MDKVFEMFAQKCFFEQLYRIFKKNKNHRNDET